MYVTLCYGQTSFFEGKRKAKREMSSNLIEAQKNMRDLIEPNEVYGGTYHNYFFGQSDFEVVVHIHLPEGTKRDEVTVSICTNRIYVCLHEKNNCRRPVLNGELYKPIRACESSWHIEDRKELVLTLAKINISGGDEWWPCVVKGQPQVNMMKFIPPSGRLQDLDEEGQATVAKLMQEQVEKRASGAV